MVLALWLGVGVFVLLFVSAVELPLRRVVLFSAGVGYFHREGEVEGSAEVELTFRIEQIPDLLKSLALQDHSGGTVASVTYASQDPPERTLSAFSADLDVQ